MKLKALAPKWAVDCDILIGGRIVHDEDRVGMGVTFACPHCVALHPGEPLERGGPIQFLGVFFRNPVDGKPHTDDQDLDHLWTRTGDTFDTLTLSPSIDASASGHWHGFITNGEISP